MFSFELHSSSSSIVSTYVWVSMYQGYYINTQRRKIPKPISFNVQFYSCLGEYMNSSHITYGTTWKIDRIKWDVCCTFMFPIKRNLINRSINFKDDIRKTKKESRQESEKVAENKCYQFSKYFIFSFILTACFRLNLNVKTIKKETDLISLTSNLLTNNLERKIYVKRYLIFLKTKSTKSVQIINKSILTIWYIWFCWTFCCIIFWRFSRYCTLNDGILTLFFSKK